MLDLYAQRGPVLLHRFRHRREALETAGDAWAMLGEPQPAAAAYRDALTLARQHGLGGVERLAQKLA